MEIEILRELIADEFDEDEIDEETDFFDDLGADWLDMIELMFACEEEFDIEIGEPMMKTVKTVGELVELIRRLAGVE